MDDTFGLHTAAKAAANKVRDFNEAHAYAVNVISREQLDAYGNYDTAHGAIKAGPIYLDTYVSTDGDRPFVECGHA